MSGPRLARNSMKWDRYGDGDTLAMWVADGDYLAPQQIVDALKTHVEHEVLGYDEVPAGLNANLCDYLIQHSWAVEKDWILWIPGLVPALYLATKALADGQGPKAGDAILCPTPIYGPMMKCVPASGLRLATIAMEQMATRPRLSADGLSDAISQNPGALGLMFCNPHNPGGTVYSREELEELADLCLRHRLPVISDEVHCDLIYSAEQSHTHIATLNKDIQDLSITLLSPSKVYNIAGLSCAAAIIPNPQLRQRFKNQCRGICPMPNNLGMVAAKVAWSGACDDWLVSLKQHLAHNRQMIEDCLSAFPEVGYQSPEATFLAWMEVSKLGITQGREYFEDFGLGLSDGTEFETPGFVRLNFATDENTVAEACKRLATGLQAARTAIHKTG